MKTAMESEMKNDIKTEKERHLPAFFNVVVSFHDSMNESVMTTSPYHR